MRGSDWLTRPYRKPVRHAHETGQPRSGRVRMHIAGLLAGRRPDGHGSRCEPAYEPPNHLTVPRISPDTYAGAVPRSAMTIGCTTRTGSPKRTDSWGVQGCGGPTRDYPRSLEGDIFPGARSQRGVYMRTGSRSVLSAGVYTRTGQRSTLTVGVYTRTGCESATTEGCTRGTAYRHGGNGAQPAAEVRRAAFRRPG